MKNYFNPYDLTAHATRLAASVIPVSHYTAHADIITLTNSIQGMLYSIQLEFDTMQAEINSLKAKIEELEKLRQPNPHLDLDLSN